MALKEELKGYWEIAKNSHYLLVYLGLMNRFDRTQELTYNGFTGVFTRDFNKLKRSARRPRIARINSRFVKTTPLDLDVEYLRRHYHGIVKHSGGETGLKILEVGAGHGRTLYPLATLLSENEFYGLEYTAVGPESCQAFWETCQDEIQYVAQSVNRAVANHTPSVKEVISADAKKMPYADKTFDVSYSNLVLEQIPRPEDHLKVLSEMYRVTKRFCCFLEPWYDAQDPLTLAYLHHNDYFRARSSVLKQVGFQKVTFYPMTAQHNLKFKVGYVVAEV